MAPGFRSKWQLEHKLTDLNPHSGPYLSPRSLRTYLGPVFLHV